MDSNILMQQFPLALVLVYLQNWLKNQPWFPVITQEQTKINSKLNHVFSIFVSGLATVGIHVTLNAAKHQLVIDWPTTAILLTGVWHWVTQYVLAKSSYHLLAGKLPVSKPVASVTLPYKAVMDSEVK